MRIIFIFIDGLGLGRREPAANPVYAAKAPTLRRLLEGPDMITTDATLGVKGLPQSATGQTTIFTGVNASRVLGRHLSGQPTVTLKNLINRDNLFKALLNMGLKVTNANVYRQEYLDRMLDPEERLHRPSVTSVMTMSAGLEFRTVEHYNNGLGVYHDITGRIIRESGYDAELITPEQAAERLYSISRAYDFTLFEHFMTDIVGHAMDMDMAVGVIEVLDRFLGSLTELVDPDEDTVLITSDHGNIEDITVRTHTLNPVPTIILGRVPGSGRADIKSLTDITPYTVGVFKGA